MSQLSQQIGLGKRISRRGFLRVAGIGSAGFAIAIYLPRHVGGPETPQVEAADEHPDMFLHIGADGSITIKVVRQEMGQGVRTSLPMIAAEELDAELSRVIVEAGDADRRYSMGTGGSQSVYRSWDLLRRAGAGARMMLIAAAAQRWGVDASQCSTEPGVVLGPGGKSLEYGELAEDAADQTLPDEISLKDPAQFGIIGKPWPRYEGEEIVTGRAVYGMDVRIPGLRYASLERAPVPDAELLSVDDTKALKVPGVLAVYALDVGIAVVATNTWAAFQGRLALEPQWKEGAAAGFSTADHQSRMDEALTKPGKAFRDDGDAAAQLAAASEVIEARYELPFLSQAQMLPLNCTAKVEKDHAELWVPAQFPNWAKGLVERRTGLGADKIDLHVTLIGSGFGRRIYPEVVDECVAIAQAQGEPIQLVNTRADDFERGVYRPGNRHLLRAALAPDGRPAAWSHHIAGASISASWDPNTPQPESYELQGAVDLPYAVDSVRVAYTYVETPVTCGAMRAVSRVNNAFVTESFLDELAHVASKDPLEYRLQLLGDPSSSEHAGGPEEAEKFSGVLKLAADKAGWGRELAPGHGLGIAANHYSSCNTYSAEVAEVSVQDGRIRVHKVWCAVDCGMVVNPDMVRQQFEGGVVFALSAALKQRLSFENGRVRETSFREYPLLTTGEAPEVEVHIVPSSRAPGGVGEPPIPPLAPAVGNAIFAATGQRLRSLPFDLS